MAIFQNVLAPEEGHALGRNQPKTYLCLPSLHSDTVARRTTLQTLSDRFSPPPPPVSTDALAHNWHCISWAGQGQGCPKGGGGGHYSTLGGGTFLSPAPSWAGQGRGPLHKGSHLCPPLRGPPAHGARPSKTGTIPHMVRSKN